MKKPAYLALFALVAGVALVTGYAASGQQRPCQQPVCCPPSMAACCPPAVGCCPANAPHCPVAFQAPAPFAAMRCCVVPAQENVKLVEELRGMLLDTCSRDTFLLTVKALADIGPDAKSAVPAIIRTAERLGLSKDLERQVKEEEGPGMLIVECLERILVVPSCAAQCAPRAMVGVAVPPCPPQFGTFAVPVCPPAPGPVYSAPPVSYSAPVPSLPTRAQVEVLPTVELIPPPSAR